MAHQLDFHVTLWSDDPDTLLAIELQLNKLADESNNDVRIGTYLDIINTAAIDADFTDINVHSIDINWDDEKVNDMEDEPYFQKLLNDAIVSDLLIKADPEEED